MRALRWNRFRGFRLQGSSVWPISPGPSHFQSLASAPREPPDLIFTKTTISQKAAKIKGFLHLSALLVNGEQIFLLFTHWPKLQIPANIFFTYPIGRLLFPQHCGRVH